MEIGTRKIDGSPHDPVWTFQQRGHYRWAALPVRHSRPGQHRLDRIRFCRLPL